MRKADAGIGLSVWGLDAARPPVGREWLQEAVGFRSGDRIHHFPPVFASDAIGFVAGAALWWVMCLWADEAAGAGAGAEALPAANDATAKAERRTASRGLVMGNFRM
jgi:hypothetical protein